MLETKGAFADRVGIFSPTHDKDAIYDHIKHELNAQGTPMFVSHDIFDEETGESLISRFMVAEKEDDECYVHVFDDLGAGCRHPTMTHYLKQNRHHKVKNIISIQSATDIEPSGWRQVDYCILLRSIPVAKLEAIHKHMTISVDFQQLLEIYNRATSGNKYDFLCIDLPGNRFLKNMTTLL